MNAAPYNVQIKTKMLSQVEILKPGIDWHRHEGSFKGLCGDGIPNTALQIEGL